MADATTLPLAPDDANMLCDFARACRAATRAVGLYPPDHPAIRISLARISDVCERATVHGPLDLTVLPHDLLLDGRMLARPDAAVSELAELLHQHLVGELTIGHGANEDAWRRFLSLVASDPAEIRQQGGIGRSWSVGGDKRIELRELDYSEILKAREGGRAADWREIVFNCLQGDAVDLDERTLRAIIEIIGDSSRLAELATAIEERAISGGSAHSQAAALVRMLRGVMSLIASTTPERREHFLGNIATVVSRLSPDMMVELLAAEPDSDRQGEQELVREVVARMTDSRLVQFVSSALVRDAGATARLAEAFQALVPEPDGRRRILRLAEPQVAASALGRASGFDELWPRIEELLVSYKDENWVPSGYAQELTTLQMRAADSEVITDDPPDRLAAWLGTVSDAAVRSLDLQLLLDMLRVENDAFRWRDLTRIVTTQVEDLVLIGDFAGARQLVEALLSESSGGTFAPMRRSSAQAAIERLLDRSVLVHIVYHLQTVGDEDFANVKALCLALGPGIIKPLAEILTVEERVRVRQRLSELLIAFGSLGRQSVEQLKNSANPSVRRTAVYLLREFGGSEALPDLALLLDDAEPHVQREAVRAIVQIGTDEAYAVLSRALTSSGERTRQAIFSHLKSATDERATPLFCYIVRQGARERRLRHVYLNALAVLGTLGGSEAVAALRETLYRGEWWAPFRTATSRATAARALREIGTQEALGVLREAAAQAGHGVRSAARAQIEAAEGGRSRSRRQM